MSPGGQFLVSPNSSDGYLQFLMPNRNDLSEAPFWLRSTSFGRGAEAGCDQESTSYGAAELPPFRSGCAGPKRVLDPHPRAGTPPQTRTPN